MQRVVHPGDMVQRFQRCEVMLQGCAENWPVSRRPLRKASGDLADCSFIPDSFCIDKPSADSLPEEYREVLYLTFSHLVLSKPFHY